MERWIKVEGLEGVGRRGVKKMTARQFNLQLYRLEVAHTHIQ